MEAPAELHPLSIDTPLESLLTTLSGVEEEFQIRKQAIDCIQLKLSKSYLTNEDFTAMVDPLCSQLTDLRSSMIKLTCSTIEKMCVSLGNQFGLLAVKFFPFLSRLLPNTTKAMSLPANNCLLFIIEKIQMIPEFLQSLQQGAVSSNPKVRAACVHFLKQAILSPANETKETLKGDVSVFEKVLSDTLKDREADVRNASKELYSVLDAWDPDACKRVFDKVEPNVQKTLSSLKKSSSSSTAKPRASVRDAVRASKAAEPNFVLPKALTSVSSLELSSDIKLSAPYEAVTECVVPPLTAIIVNATTKTENNDQTTDTNTNCTLTEERNKGQEINLQLQRKDEEISEKELTIKPIVERGEAEQHPGPKVAHEDMNEQGNKKEMEIKQLELDRHEKERKLNFVKKMIEEKSQSSERRGILKKRREEERKLAEKKEEPENMKVIPSEHGNQVEKATQCLKPLLTKADCENEAFIPSLIPSSSLQDQVNELKRLLENEVKARAELQAQFVLVLRKLEAGGIIMKEPNSFDNKENLSVMQQNAKTDKEDKLKEGRVSKSHTMALKPGCNNELPL